MRDADFLEAEYRTLTTTDLRFWRIWFTDRYTKIQEEPGQNFSHMLQHSNRKRPDILNVASRSGVITPGQVQC